MNLPRPGERRSELRLRARCIPGDLDLRGLRLDGPLELEDVEVMGDLRLDEARLLAIEARGLRVHGCLSLDAVHCRGLLRLRQVELGSLRAGSAQCGAELQLQGQLHGDLDAAGLQLAGGLELPGLVVSGRLILAGAWLQGWADLSRVAAGPVDARGLRAESGLELRAARVAGGVDLLDAALVGALSLRNAALAGALCLRRARCGDRLDLVRLQAQQIDARGLRVQGDASLADVRCQSLDLQEARLEGVELRGAAIQGPLQARALRCGTLSADGLQLQGQLALADARLEALGLADAQLGGLVLADAEIATDCLLPGIHVRGDADLRARVAGNLDLGQSLWDARLELTPAHLGGRIQLAGARAAHARADFAMLRRHLPDDAAQGWACCKVLQTWLEAENQYEVMDSAILAGHRFRRRLLARRWGGLGVVAAGIDALLLGASCGYGLRPARVLASATLLILLSALLCWAQPQAFGGALSCSEALHCALAWASGAPLAPRAPAADSLPALLPPLLGLAGVLLAALFVGTLTRRLAR